MNVLFFMSHGVFARNFEWVLRELAQRDHRVHVALDRLEKRGIRDANELLEALARAHPSFTFGAAPTARWRDFATAGRAFRLVLDYLRYLDPEYAHAGKARDRMEHRMPRPLRHVLRLGGSSPQGRAILRAAARLADSGVPVRVEARQYIRTHAPDVVVVTPLVDPGSPQTEYVRAARELGIASALAVHSWDNLTLKGGIHETPEAVLVWNDVQRREAIELHGVPPERVVVTGAVAYDHWFSWSPPMPREVFCHRVGLDPARPYVLYLGSSRFIAPNELEFVREWATELARRLPDVQMLVRPHPLNTFAGDSLPPTAAVTVPGDAEPMDASSRGDYFATIAYSEAVVGVLTSGMVEAAILGKPVHALVDSRHEATQRGTLHFEYLRPEHGGFLRLASDHDEHATHIRESLERASPARASLAFVESFIRPFGIDEPAAARFADALEQLRSPVVVPGRLRPAARAAAALGWAALRSAQVLRHPSSRRAPAGASPLRSDRPL